MDHISQCLPTDVEQPKAETKETAQGAPQWVIEYNYVQELEDTVASRFTRRGHPTPAWVQRQLKEALEIRKLITLRPEFKKHFGQAGR